MSMTVSAATASAWNSYAAWSRLASAQQKLSTDLSPVPACDSVLTADRAAVVTAAHEVVRIEARRTSDIAHLRADNRTFDLMV